MIGRPHRPSGPPIVPKGTRYVTIAEDGDAFTHGLGLRAEQGEVTRIPITRTGS